MIFFTFFLISYGFITYDEGKFRAFQIVTGVFLCFDNKERSRDITFRDSFENIPQIILIPELFDIPGTKVDYNLEITQITLTKFTLRIKCFGGVVQGVHYKWLAIDDARVQVINKFNIRSFEQITLDHPNPNALKCLISVIAFSFTGAVNFEVKVSELNTKSLTIQITGPQNQLQYLTSLSYQIVLGINEIFEQYQQQAISLPYISPQFTLIQWSWFLLPFQGFQLNGINATLFKKEYALGSNSLAYQFNGGNFQSDQTTCCCLQTSKHIPQWMKFYDITDATFLEIGSVLIKQFFDSKVDYIQSFKVIIEGDYQIATDLGKTRLIIDETDTQPILNVRAKCTNQETLKINLNFQNPNENSITNPILHNCQDSYQEIIISFSLIPTQVAYQDLIVDIQETECQISQVLFNQRQIRRLLFFIQKQ
ncbi:unnamed protein product (macronuclear) [Paramecium tetraurelia]|uniref:H-type lectin domain-containing protein n=1 Tax=Paramecium tetraurelia TaxID=5888 RepID=A0DLW4_PARTE|nr:uncharacterized protein GSPATT00039664001 [Paramecium tetraurelia]CAK84031.1 unnamed protein product [Paramecium tetraurelia]|eukprot:XP_001451428.1 hypothetical protein (macronuclear) [Paramecium tetraurelia strain d4-2]